jgi:hypothetical protein
MAVEPIDFKLAYWAGFLATKPATLVLNADGEPSRSDEDPMETPTYCLTGPLGLHGDNPVLWASVNREAGVWDPVAA